MPSISRSSSSATSCRLPFLRPSAREIFDEARATRRIKRTRKPSPDSQSSDVDDSTAGDTDDENSLACDKTIIETIPYRHDVPTASILPSSHKAQIKQAVINALLDAIRANRTPYESIWYFLASEQEVLKDEISTSLRESNKIVDMHDSVSDKLVQVLSKKKRPKDLYRCALLQATRNDLAEMHDSKIPDYNAKKNQLAKIEDRVEEAGQVVIEEHNRETKLMQILGQTREPGSASSSSESSGSGDSWLGDEDGFVMDL